MTHDAIAPTLVPTVPYDDVAAGAEIVRPLHVARTPAFPDGSRQFDVRDPGGHLWTVGTFQPRFPLGAIDPA